jgi:hypothetical protein
MLIPIAIRHRHRIGIHGRIIYYDVYHGRANFIHSEMSPIQKMLLTKINNELPNYRQDRYRFYKEDADFSKIIQVQFLNLPENRISFTIHFGIYVPILDKILWGRSKAKSIEVGQGVFFCNINSILTGFESKPKVKYWNLDNLESLFVEIRTLIRSQLIPFSEKINSLEDLNNLINSIEFPGKYVATYPILSIVLKYVLERRGEVKQILQKLETEDPVFFRPLIEDMNKRLIDFGYKPVN